MMARADRVETARIFREEAEREGFPRVGIARAEPPARFDRVREWIGAGRHAGMRYLEATAQVRASPARLLPGAASVVCLAAPHRSEPLRAADGSLVARYAAGPDYHGSLRKRAIRVAEHVSARLDEPFEWRVCVDSTPLAERSFAAAAGLGWIGKNGCLIDRELGSYLLLAEILTDLDLPPDDPVAEMCGSCVRCLDSCPTGAFVGPAVLDAARCLAYWTIESRGPLPDEVKIAMGEHVFGCDVCQEACPWTDALARRAGATSPDDARPGRTLPTRLEWIEMGKGEWRRRFGASALNRAGRRGLQRNAAASAGAVGDAKLLAALRPAAQIGDRGLSDAARWASGRIAVEIERTS
jgi:epoxyqueuosine reductase